MFWKRNIFNGWGDQAEREVNVRVVAASNQDLQTRIAEGSFRQDLYYRLARFTLTLPTLRERPEDVPILATHFIRMFAIEMNVKPPEISQDTLNMLKAYTFPGNVRELKNLMERGRTGLWRAGCSTRTYPLRFWTPVFRTAAWTILCTKHHYTGNSLRPGRSGSLSYSTCP